MNQTEMNDLTMKCPQVKENVTTSGIYSIEYPNVTGGLSPQSQQAGSRSETPVSFADPEVSSIGLNQIRGSIHIILGPMFSGKTSRVWEKLKFYSSGKNSKKCILVTNKKASEESCSTAQDEKFTRLECFTLGEVTYKLKKFDFIAIDEAQFFPDIVETCENLANEGKIVLVAALDGTFEREVFGEVLKLIPKAETVEKLRANCYFCGKKASFSFRLTNQKALVVIGKQFYQPACRTCHLLEMQKKPNSSEGHSNNPPTDQQSETNSDNTEEAKEAEMFDKAEEIPNEDQQPTDEETSLDDQSATNREEYETDEMKSLTFYRSQDFE